MKPLAVSKAIAKASPMTSVAVVLVVGASPRGQASCNDDMNIEGIFTDGDLRRIFDMGVDLNNAKIADLMTPGGIKIAPSMLAVEALNLMQSKHVTSLLVADNNKLVGVLHMHDLLQAGVV